jgi:glucose-6-phosphate dehydrogenase assembly protein OpcA
MAAAPLRGLTQVAVPNVEAALADRRRTMLAALERPNARSCVMTLVIAVEDEREHQSSIDIIGQLAGKYPLRVIVVGRLASARDQLCAWVNLECGQEASRAICSEEIVLQGGVESTDRIASSVRGLIRSDLPVMLWWRGGVPLASPSWQILFALSDRIIVDSHRFQFDAEGPSQSQSGTARPDGRRALSVLRELVQASGARACLRDLNWQRTAPWRAAIATCFDDSDVLALLPTLDRCAVTFSAQSKNAAPSARALLMAGWLINRSNRLRAHCAIGAGTHWPGVQAGRIVAITLTSSTSKASLVLVRESSPVAIRAQANTVEGKPMRRWDFGASTLSEAELLDGCMETIGRDTLFERALQTAP